MIPGIAFEYYARSEPPIGVARVLYKLPLLRLPTVAWIPMDMADAFVAEQVGKGAEIINRTDYLAR